MTTRNFFAQGVATLDGAGNGTATVRPSGEVWSVNAVTVNVSTRTLEAQCRIYRNFVGDTYLIDSTISGSTGDTSDTVHEMMDGDSLIAVWSGGDPGATAYLVVRGVSSEFSAGGFRAV